MRTANLLPFEETTRRLRVTSRTYLGVREIPLARIIGSVGRSQDLDRGFGGRPGLSPDRLRALHTAFPTATPRRSTSSRSAAATSSRTATTASPTRSRDAQSSSALRSPVCTPTTGSGPGGDICQLVHPEQQQQLLQHSGLSQARSEATSSSPCSTATPRPATSSRPTATTSPATVVYCPHRRKSPRTGTTPSTCPPSPPLNARPSRAVPHLALHRRRPLPVALPDPPRPPWPQLYDRRRRRRPTPEPRTPTQYHHLRNSRRPLPLGFPAQQDWGHPTNRGRPCLDRMDSDDFCVVTGSTLSGPASDLAVAGRHSRGRGPRTGPSWEWPWHTLREARRRDDDAREDEDGEDRSPFTRQDRGDAYLPHYRDDTVTWFSMPT